ncbi:MAG: VOC family protein [Anaerovoracaceae bacterium]
MKLKNILIVVEDMERSRKFYEEIFGLKVVADFTENVVMTQGLALQTRKSWEKFTGKSIIFGGNNGELYFEENNIDGFVKKLADYESIEYVHELITHDWGQRVVRFYDPDGHMIEVGESMELVNKRNTIR